MMIDPRNAEHLALWIAANHPGLFVTLFAKQARARALSGLGQDDSVLMEVQPSVSYVDPSIDTAAVDTSSMDTSALDVQPVTVTASYVSPDQSAADTLGLSLAPIDTSSLDIAPGPLPQVDVTSADSSGTASSGLSSALSSLGSTLASAVSGVASYLTSPTGLRTAGAVAQSYFATQAAGTSAQTQQAILQAQAARVAAGLPPAAVSYQVNPATGQLMPTIATTAGQAPLTSSLLSAITPGGSYGTILLLGGAALLLLLLL